MCRQLVISMVMTLGIAASHAGGAVVFEDRFGSLGSISNWRTLFGSITRGVDDGVFKLTNTGSNFGFVKLNGVYTDFTLEATLATAPPDSNKMAGIAFCWDTTANTGYTFLLLDGQVYSILAFNQGGASSLVSQSWNSYIKPDNNVFKVSKQGSTIRFFVNGYTVHTLTGAAHTTGSIGLVVDGLETAHFDDIVITDAFEAPYIPERFVDDFSSGDLEGWSLLFVNGSASVSGGHLVMESNHPQYASFLYTDGAYSLEPVKTRVRYVSGDTTAFYGIVLSELEREGAGITPSKQSVLCISADRYWAAFSSGTYIPSDDPRIHGRGEWDTLEVTDSLDLIVNGYNIGGLGQVPFVFNAAGVWVARGVTVEYDDFEAGDTNYTVNSVANPRRISAGPGFFSLVKSGSGFMYNPLGRAVVNHRAGMLPVHTACGYYIIVNRTGSTARRDAVVRLR